MTDTTKKTPLLLVIFGITGDLAHRKLLPALYSLVEKGLFPRQFRVVGVTRQEYSSEQLYADFEKNCKTACDPKVVQTLKQATSIITMPLNQATAYVDLCSSLEKISVSLGSPTRLYYLSIPAQAFTDIITQLGETGHATPLGNETAVPRLLVEKPFGYNLASAEALIAAAAQHFTDEQIYRIDHYLAKETAQNILTFRFDNALFENSWNARFIKSIEVTMYETIGIEGRAHFYEQTGALRDLLQSHLLQLLALVTMENPGAADSSSFHRAKLRLLESITPIQADAVSTNTFRGQYETYRKEVDNTESITETFARLKLVIDNEKWRGTAIVLETGKAMAIKESQIIVTFRQPDQTIPENQLIFHIQPHEGITLTLQAKRPGLSSETETVNMNFDYHETFGDRQAEAYQRVIIDAVRGDQSLFLSSQEVLASWRIVEHVMRQWQTDGSSLHIYPNGSSPKDL